MSIRVLPLLIILMLSINVLPPLTNIVSVSSYQTCEAHKSKVTFANATIVIGDGNGYVHYLLLSGKNSPSKLWSVKLSEGTIHQVKIADLDGDQVPEVIAADSTGNIYCLNAENGYVLWNFSGEYGGFWLPIFTEDLDKDGIKEIITAMCAVQPNKAFVLVLNRDGTIRSTFTPPIYPLPRTSKWPRGIDSIDMGDFNGDGIKDLVLMFGAVLYPENQPRIMILDLTSKAIHVLFDFTHTYGGGMTFMDLGDVDSDGTLEIVTGGWWVPVTVFEKDGTVLWKRDVKGGNADRRVLYVADLNGDGRQAILVGTAAYYETSLYLYALNPTNGMDIWEKPVTFTANGYVAPVAVKDLDADGRNEIIVYRAKKPREGDILAIVDGTSGDILQVLGYSWGIEGVWARMGGKIKNCIFFDLDGDGAQEIITGKGRYLICIDRVKSLAWTYDLSLNTTYGPLLSIDIMTPIFKPETTITQPSQPPEEEGLKGLRPEVLIPVMVGILVLALLLKKKRGVPQVVEERPETSIVKVCPYCGASIAVKARFCPHCGSYLEE